MSALERAAGHHLELLEAFREGLPPEPAWLGGLRDAAAAAFREQGFPSTRWEEWRYTSLAPLAALPLRLADADVPALERERVEEVCFPVFACSLFVFVDGHFSPALSSAGGLPGGARLESLAALRAEAPEGLEGRLGQLLGLKEQPFAALNTAFLDDGAVITVPRGAQVPQPIHVVFASAGTGPARVRHPRVLLSAEEGSRVQLIQDHVTLAEHGGFTNAVTELHVGPNAQVDHVLIQRESPDTFHISSLVLRQERDSRCSAHTLTLGGRLVRNDLRALLADEGADCTLNGLFVGSGEQVVDNHTLVDHALPHGTSRQLYKGILGGASRGVFRGRVIVRPGAQKTSAEQSNPNLLLSEGAEVDTRPQLEIHADDVRCSHGSSIGQIDEDALFYLRSRGIEEARGRDLLTRGFAAAVLEALPVEALHDGLDELLLECLARASGRRAETGS